MFYDATFLVVLSKIQIQCILILLSTTRNAEKNNENIVENIFRRIKRLLGIRERIITKKIETRSVLNKRNIVDALRLWKEAGFSAVAIGKLKNQKIMPMAGKKEIQKNTAFINVPDRKSTRLN